MSEPASTDRVQTFGCRLNIVESAAMRMQARRHGLDAVSIVNTCAVTADAARKSRAAVRRALRDRPDARVIVSGCASQIDAPSFATLSERVVVLPNAAKAEAATWRALAGGPSPVAAPVMRDATHTRAFLAVQNGCDHRCTFCVIPFGRGASRSLPRADAVAAARALVEAGHRDIVLTGVDLTAWGRDLDPQTSGDVRFGDLVRAILRDVPDLARLRLSSLDCIEADEALLDVIANEERLMPHLHLSLQSGDDLILKRMKRRHSRADAMRFCAQVRRLRPDIVFGADLIVGFPTETEAMARATRALAEDCGLTHLHVFPYSARPDTPAARMPPVPSATIGERAARLREEGARRLALHLAPQVGGTFEVLVERGAIGRTRDFTPVRVPSTLMPGTFAHVRIAGHDGQRLIAADGGV